jgi:hypothetical protein
MADPTPLPIACTLTGASLEERAAWLGRLGEESLIDGVRAGDGLELLFRPEAAADLGELVRAEAECCSFLAFEIDPREGQIRLGISGPTESGSVLDDMLAALRGAYR